MIGLFLFEPKSLSDVASFLDKVLHYRLFELNKTPVTFSSILMFLLVLLIFFILSRILNRGVLKRVLGRFHVEEGTRYTLIRISHYLVMIVGTVVAFQFVGVNLGGLAVIFGLLSVGIGFGLQNVTSNFISGLILLLERPIKVGDRITVGGTEGDVTAINMRATTIQSLENISIIVPNSEFVSSKVTNWSYGESRVRLSIDVGVSYNSDLDTVLKALTEVADDHPKVLRYPAPDVLFVSFGDSSWNMRLRAWIEDPKEHPIIQSELNKDIVRKFRKYNVEIPFPQRDLHVRSPLPVPLSTDAREQA